MPNTLDNWSQWEASSPVDTIEGARIQGPVMRRKVDGNWQYRKMTPDEERDYMSSAAW